MFRRESVLLRLLIVISTFGAFVVHSLGAAGQESNRKTAPNVFRRENLVAWCIVPFDGKKRGPAERAEMVKQLGLKRIAYDWRDEHIPTFEQEILEYKKRGLDYFAFWGTHPKAFELFRKHDLHPQIWFMFSDPKGESQVERVENAARQLLPLVEQTRKAGCKLGLYNHGGWSGEPKNMVAVCRYLHANHNAGHVGIVYNQHHAHDHIDDFADVIKLLNPYLLCLNLNGMDRGSDKVGRKILPLGVGKSDVRLLKAIRDSNYNGPIGIIGHTQDDVRQRLQDNLDGLDWILPQLNGKPPGPKPILRTWPAAKTSGKKMLLDEYSPQSVAAILENAKDGDAHRGLVQFASANSACVSCHRVGKHGGTVGPDLSEIAKQRKPEEIVEAVVWPNRHVEPKYNARLIVTANGKSLRGYVVNRDERELVLKDPTRPGTPDESIDLSEIELEQEIGTLMPDKLIAAMSPTQRNDLFRFLLSLGRDDGIPAAERDMLLLHASSHAHGPAAIPIDRKPLRPQFHPYWQHSVNRDRLYDFYAKQADHFKRQSPAPMLLAEFPGLDGGDQGHWGNQNEDVWANDDWNRTDLGSMQSGVFRGAGVTVARGVCVRLGDDQELSTCFNPDTLSYDAVWKDGFVNFSSVRHGFIGGLTLDGTPLPRPVQDAADGAIKYNGFYRHGHRIVFSYRIGDTEFLDSPWVKDGQFVRTVVRAADDSSLSRLTRNASTSWPQRIQTDIVHGDTKPYAVDTIDLPTNNPWKSLTYVGGLAFMPDGSAMICTMQGDVWHASNIQYPSKSATWRRFATGLHQPLGMVIDEDGIFVMCRDQLTRLHDLNEDGEADFYECFSNAHVSSIGGHDFICGLQRDRDGNFYAASGNQGIVRFSPDGSQATVIATGFRNPDGLGLLPDGTVTVPGSEGSWTPASMICAVRPSDQPSFHGYGGPRNNEPPELPLVYIPRGIDNSAGGQTTVTSDRWGPLDGQLLHFSFGTGSYHLVLRDEVDGQLQGALVPLPGEFRSGSHRGRFNPADGQLYVGGMQGWGSYTPDTGSFQRVRCTDPSTQLPTQWRAHENGIAIRFSARVDASFATNIRNHFAQCWNYRYSKAYGSPEFSTVHAGMKGHDVLVIKSAHVVEDDHVLFLEIPDLQPVNQLHLRIATDAKTDHELFATVHKLRSAFTNFATFEPHAKTIKRHPIYLDLALASRNIFNPYSKTKRGAREVVMTTSGNLSFDTRRFTAKPGELLALKLVNSDVVPHNWALVKTDSLERGW